MRLYRLYQLHQVRAQACGAWGGAEAETGVGAEDLEVGVLYGQLKGPPGSEIGRRGDCASPHSRSQVTGKNFRMPPRRSISAQS